MNICNTSNMCRHASTITQDFFLSIYLQIKLSVFSQSQVTTGLSFKVNVILT